MFVVRLLSLRCVVWKERIITRMLQQTSKVHIVVHRVETSVIQSYKLLTKVRQGVKLLSLGCVVFLGNVVCL